MTNEDIWITVKTIPIIGVRVVNPSIVAITIYASVYEIV